MTVRLFAFLLIALLVPSFGNAATRTLEIVLSFDTSAVAEKTVIGYTLYQDSLEACVTNNATATSILCEVEAEDGTHIYELAARYDDGTYSPKSPPFEFAIGSTDSSTPPPPTSQPPTGDTNTGNYLVNYSWETTVQDSSLAGYRMYLNDILLCETSDISATTLSCYADLINEVMNFSIASYDINNVESLRSNFLTLDPADFPELFNKKALTFTWEYADGTSNAGGFQVYNNGDLLCQTADSAARTLKCTLDQLLGQHEFSLAAVSDIGEVTTFSNIIAYSDSTGDTGTPPPSTELSASISTSATSGVAPLSVMFDATSSTGAIDFYTWDFGDGDSGSGPITSHIYTIPGTYSTTLQVYDNTGNSTLASVIITVEDSPVVLNPPVAIIASSTASGEAPLNVSFDGSASSTQNSSIVSYEWDFGDGAKGIGSTISHSYATAGTFNATLMVTDGAGLTNTASTPVIVTQATVVNQPPSASFTATPTEGTSPLTILFDGSASTDYDGLVAGYNWNFGDGTTGTGQTVQHTYTSAATYTVTLQAIDDLGAKSPLASKTISVEEAPSEIILNYEIGELAITPDWVKVHFTNTFKNPAVFVSPPSNNDQEPVTTRLRNVTATGFEIRLQEWDYLDDKHAAETISYLVIEKGRTLLPSGGAIEVGSFNAKTRKQTISFSQPFQSAPIVVTSIFTINETDAVIHRTSGITPTGFTSLLQEQQSTSNKHADESVAYIAWSVGEFTIDNLVFSVALPTTRVDSNPTTLPLPGNSTTLPFLFIEQQTMDGADPAAIRIDRMLPTSVTLFLQEEKSKDTEMNHVQETVGYIHINSLDQQTNWTNPN